MISKGATSADYDISISTYCNAACPSCKRYDNFHTTEYVNPKNVTKNLKQRNMKFDLFKKMIDNNWHNFVDKFVMFEGELGDPMMNTEILKFIEYGSKVFKELLVVTNGGIKRPDFYTKIGNEFKNVRYCFSIDGMDNEVNNIYRRNVNTVRAIDNMISYSETKYGKFRTIWQYLIFDHNYFEVPDVLMFAKKHELKLILKINVRERFKINQERLNYVLKIYEKYKYSNSILIEAN
jgi:MoaA/NifB/PqqE/SkfB family radical SAM enzyme